MSMKAALKDWDIDVNLFQQGLARQTDDRAIIAAAERARGRGGRRARDEAAVPGAQALQRLIGGDHGRPPNEA